MSAKKIRLAPHTCQSPVQLINWDICILCQDHGGTLIRPTEAGYTSLAKNLYSLHELNSLPLNIDISRLNDGNGLEETLITHSVKWHKACYVLCNADKIERARKRKEKVSQELPHSPVKQHLRSTSTPSRSMKTDSDNEPACFFCDDTTGNLTKVETMSLDTRVRQIAKELRDTKLLAKLSGGDMVAIDAQYHLRCLAAFYNRGRTRKRRSNEAPHHINAESLAFAEVVSYIKEYGEIGGDLNHVFKLSDIKKLYCDFLQKFGGDANTHIHSTRLAQKLQEHIPALESHNSKSGTVLSFKQDVGDALLDACNFDSDDEAIMLMRVAKLVRKEIFETNCLFNGSLCDEQYNCLPASLSALVRMILCGSNTKQNIYDKEISPAATSITQLLVFNAIKRSRADSVAVRHNLERETALPLYLGLLIHNKTRKRDLIDNLFEKGLSVSYDRVLQLSTEEANTAIDRYEKEGCVCPATLRDNLFTTGNLDNIDHNPSSTSSQDSFHGTAISITQHVTNDNPGVVRALPVIPDDTANRHMKSIRSLPKSYTDVPPISLSNDVIPIIADQQLHALPAEKNDDQRHKLWLEHVRAELAKEQTEDQVNMDISWSAFFATLQLSVPKPPAIISLLPLFRDSAHSPSMVKHGMDIIREVTHHVNPGQIPVLTVDQPLYAIAKRIQWKWPDEYGQRQYVVLMGGLHIEMAMLKVIGDWLDGSGWTYVMIAGNVTTEGRASNVQKGSHISRGQWAHQVTSAALYILLHRAYAEYQLSIPEIEQLHFDAWCQQMSSDYSQFYYWYKVWQLELLFLEFLRSQREQNYVAYVESLRKIIPWMFALDHYHYARWMTVHVSDLLALQKKCPSIHAEFLKGNFVTQKSKHKFSALAHDQVHEQLNAVVKGDGGIIGITENDAALRRWMIAGPETARVLIEYNDYQPINKNDTARHHEQIPSVQKMFLSHVKNVTEVMEELGNPFADASTDLYSLETKQIMSKRVVEAVRSAEDMGIMQYQKFVVSRINSTTTAFNDTIHKNNLPLLNSISVKKSNTTSKVSNLQNDVQLFSRMYISCQSRESDMDAFFAHENHAWPPSLASNGIMHHTSKSDLLECLEPLVPHPESIPKVDVKIIDGAALVHMLDPHKSSIPIRTFRDYSQLVFLPYIKHILRDVVRVDVVWDIYKENSLKTQTRQDRGSGNHIRVDNTTKIPANWKNFLRCDANKDNFFKLLASAIQEFEPPAQKQVISTHGPNAVSSPITDMYGLFCTQEEADTRLLFHASHSFHHGYNKVMVHATDTDVVVIAVAVSRIFQNCEVWVAFGHGNKLRYIPCHLIANALGTDASCGLLFFHAVSGCDTVSAFRGVGKKTAWAIWRSMPHLDQIFARLSHAPKQILPEDLKQLERFVVLLYQRTSPLSRVNDARKQMFTQNRRIDNIPPTAYALEQHVKRAAYQAGHIWGQSLIGNPELPPPHMWGWKRETGDPTWTPHWTTLPEAGDACHELLKCGCKKSCTNRCKCVKANLQCTLLCACSGQCNRQS